MKHKNNVKNEQIHAALGQKITILRKKVKVLHFSALQRNCVIMSWPWPITNFLWLVKIYPSYRLFRVKFRPFPACKLSTKVKIKVNRKKGMMLTQGMTFHRWWLWQQSTKHEPVSMDPLFLLALKLVVIKDYECVLRLWYNSNSSLLLKSLSLRTAENY